MQDVFIEYMVKKRNPPSVFLLKILIVAAAALLFYLFFMISLFLGELGFIAVLMAFASAYGAYLLIGSFNLEYEYALTNGDMDVDKIISMRRRKRLITIKFKEAEDFGKYKASEHENKKYDTKIIACDSPQSENLWFCSFRHKDKGLVLVVFNVSERMLEGIKPFLPRPIMHRVFRIGA